jgi:hypothetical protein
MEMALFTKGIRALPNPSPQLVIGSQPASQPASPNPITARPVYAQWVVHSLIKKEAEKNSDYIRHILKYF